MSTRGAAIELAGKLPDDLDEIIDEVFVRRKIEDGLRQLDTGEGILHEEVWRRLARWLE